MSMPAPRRLRAGARACALRGDHGRDVGPVRDPGLDGIREAAPGSEPVDHVEPIGDDGAVAMTRRLATEGRILVGMSTNANVVGAHRLAERLGPDAESCRSRSTVDSST
jgi:hypothetical protein